MDIYQFNKTHNALSSVFDAEHNPIDVTEQELNTLGEIIEQYGKHNVMYGKKHTTETRCKMSEKNKALTHITTHYGKDNGMYGRQHTTETKKIQSEKRRSTNLRKMQEGINVTACMNNLKKTCSHCGITTTSGNYSRWHGDKCKHKS